MKKNKSVFQNFTRQLKKEKEKIKHKYIALAIVTLGITTTDVEAAKMSDSEYLNNLNQYSNYTLFETISRNVDFEDYVEIYEVQKGDTVDSLADKFGISEEELREANKLGDNNHLKIGEYILITNGFTLNVTIGDEEYTGSSVEEVADLADISYDDLSSVIDNSVIRNKTVEAELYTVKVGDTYNSIAWKNNTTLEKLLEDNKISDNSTPILGEVFVINRTPKLTYKIDGKIYSVDTVEELAKKSGLDENKLYKLLENYISINNEISIELYIVRSGDNIYKIANLFDLSVEELIESNYLNKNNTIEPGDLLIIEKPFSYQITLDGKIVYATDAENLFLQTGLSYELIESLGKSYEKEK